MSEQEKPKSFFMEELDRWSDANVINPLVLGGDIDEGVELTQEIIDQVKKAIRAKVLESYRNGQAAGPRQFSRQPRRDYPPRKDKQPARWPVHA